MNKGTLVKTFEEACQIEGKDLNTVPQFLDVEEDLRPFMVANYKMAIINRVINGEPLDWNNYSEWKWYAYWDMEVTESNPSGFSFWYSDDAYTLTASAVGSRLCFNSKEKLLHAVEHFKDLYRDIYLVPKQK